MLVRVPRLIGYKPSPGDAFSDAGVTSKAEDGPQKIHLFILRSTRKNDYPLHEHCDMKEAQIESGQT